MTDRIRVADEDKPKGYYEFERVKGLPEDTGWLEDARGKVVKVLAELVQKLPAGYSYRIVFVERDLDEIIASQKKMLVRRGEDPDQVPDSEIKELFRKYASILRDWLGKQSNMRTFYISYNDVMNDPDGCADRLDAFFGGSLDRDKMISVIDDNLYRNRN